MKERTCKLCDKEISNQNASGLCVSCVKKGKRGNRWIGENASYSAKHCYVNRHWKKLGVCERCRKSRKTQWSNNSKMYYRDRSDWEELCVSCHTKKDMTDETRRKVSAFFKGKVFARTCPVEKTDGHTKVRYSSMSEAARKNRILVTGICNCLMGRAKTAGGYVWRYV